MLKGVTATAGSALTDLATSSPRHKFLWIAWTASMQLIRVVLTWDYLQFEYVLTLDHDNQQLKERFVFLRFGRTTFKQAVGLSKRPVAQEFCYVLFGTCQTPHPLRFSWRLNQILYSKIALDVLWHTGSHRLGCWTVELSQWRFIWNILKWIQRYSKQFDQVLLRGRLTSQKNHASSRLTSPEAPKNRAGESPWHGWDDLPRCYRC